MLGKDEEYFKLEKDIQEIAERIVRKCGGLPLVIITIARALATTSSLKGWRDAECLLRSSPDGYNRKLKDVFKLLKFSFDYLERDEYRSCLLFCALYPEDWEISIDEVIRYWIGEGLLEFTGLSNLSELEAFGRQCIISTLGGACLLEKGRNRDHVKLHDSIRDMAIWLGKGGEDGNYRHKFLPLESWEGTNMKAITVDSTWKDVKRVCFRGMAKVVISGSISPAAFLNLHTLLFIGKSRSSSLVDIPKELFSFTPNLRVLDLSYNERLRKLPESLWLLKSLRYLNLSNTALYRIPEEVGQLTNLVVLDLSKNGMVSFTSYLTIPSLSKLQVLELRGTYTSSSDRGRIKDLDDLVWLSSLSLSLYTPEDVKEIQECVVLNRSISFLEICNVCLTVDEASSVLSGLSSLKKLEIIHCSKLEGTLQLPSHILQKLEELDLIGLPLVSCLEVGSQWQLPSLRRLEIHDCKWFGNFGCLVQLPNLVQLVVKSCKRMVELIPSSGQVEAATASSSPVDQSSHLSFPKLEMIELKYLRRLESISKVRLHLPSLQKMDVKECPKLAKLPVIQSKKLVTITCEKQWWQQLQWEEDGDTVRDTFLFKEYRSWLRET